MDNEVPANLRRTNGEEAWIHARFMEGSDEICFTYRRKVERLRELVTDLQRLPASERRRHRGTLRRWQRIQELEAYRLRSPVDER